MKLKRIGAKWACFALFLYFPLADSASDCEWVYDLRLEGPSYDRQWVTHPSKEDHVGDRISVYLKDDQGERIVEGSIVSQAEAGFWMVDGKSGKFEMIHAQSDPQPRVLRAHSHPFKWQFERMPKEIFKAIKEHKNPYALVTDNQDLNYIIFGRVKAVIDKNGHTLLQITASNGITHHIDPDLARIDVFITEHAPDVEALFPEANKERVHIVSGDAVANESLLNRLSSGEVNYRSKDFYDYFEKFSHDEILKLIHHLYDGLLKPEEISEFEMEAGSKNLVLLLDPGIASRISAFANFINGKSFKSSWQARKAFEKHLGDVTLYRGMFLSEADAKKIAANGMKSPGLRDTEFSKTYFRNLFKAGVTTGPPTKFAQTHTREIWEMRVANTKNPIYRMTMSFSHYPDLAESVTVQSNEGLLPPGLKLHLFRVRMPALSTIPLEGPFDFKLLPNAPKEKPFICVGTNCYNRFTDKRIEVFVPLAIPASQIENVRKIEGDSLKFDLRQFGKES